jgi:pimeloyl-ACP methyl ester carboxylesterase
MPLPAAPIHPQIEERAFTASHDGSRQTYLLADFGTGANLPQEEPLLVVYLHGALAHEDQGMSAGIYDHFFGRLAGWMAKQRATYVCPEYRGNSWMGPAAESDLLDVLRIERERINPSRTLLLGGSMGGTSALIFASRYPGQAHAILALCPATDPALMFPRFPEHFLASYGGPPETHASIYRERASLLRAEALAPFRMFLAHGTADTVIPLEHSRRLAAALTACGGSFRYEEIPGGDHDSPTRIDIAAAMDFLLAPR